MDLSGEDRRRKYEEEGIREEAPEEIQRESKQRKHVSLGSLGIIGVVLAVGLATILIGCGNGESTPQTALVPDSILYADAHAKTTRWPWQEGPASPGSRFPFLLEFATLSERPLEGDGIAAEILIPGEYPRGGEEDNVGPGDQPLTYEKDVKNTGEFILWQVWPKKHTSRSSSTTAWKHGRPADFATKNTRVAQPAAKSSRKNTCCSRSAEIHRQAKLRTFGLGRTSREGARPSGRTRFHLGISVESSDLPLDLIPDRGIAA